MRSPRNRRVGVVIALSVLLLTGCFQHKRMRSASVDDTLRQRIADGPWVLEGKMALSDGRNSGSGRLRWEKSLDTTRVELIAPLGQGQWQLRETAAGAWLRSSTRGELAGESAEQLLSTEIGWPVPWQALPYWLFGQSHRFADNVRETGQLPSRLQENGWEIAYSRYKSTVLGLLPYKIIARKGPYTVKVFVRRWIFPDIPDATP